MIKRNFIVSKKGVLDNFFLLFIIVIEKACSWDDKFLNMYGCLDYKKAYKQ